MTLQQISKEYAYSARLLRTRLQCLRRALDQEEDPAEAFQLRQRILTLEPILTQMNELAELTAHYYERGYYRSEKYTL